MTLEVVEDRTWLVLCSQWVGKALCASLWWRLSRCRDVGLSTVCPPGPRGERWWLDGELDFVWSLCQVGLPCQPSPMPGSPVEGGKNTASRLVFTYLPNPQSWERRQALRHLQPGDHGGTAPPQILGLSFP